MKTKSFPYLLLCMLIFVSGILSAAKYNDAIIYLHPKPGSQYHTALTTIIVKLDTSFLDNITDLSAFIKATGKEGDYTGKTFFSSDKRTIIFEPENNFNWGDTISVTIATSQMIASDYNFTFSTVETWQDDVTWHGKSATKSTNTVINDGESGLRFVNGMAVPSGFPDINTTVYGETAPGLIFFSDHGSYMAANDNEGNIYFYYKLNTGEELGNVTVQPNNTLTVGVYGHRPYGEYLVFDSTLTLIDTIEGSHGYFIDSHELQYIEHNHRLSVNEYWFSAVDGAYIHSENIHEHDSLGNVIFVWRDIDYSDYPFNVQEIHINSLEIDYDGHIVLSTRNNNQLWKINRETGDVIWILGGEDNMFDVSNDTCMFQQQHYLRPVKGNPNHYTLFDNLGGIECYNQDVSRALEYYVDTNNWTAELVWYYANPGYYHWNMGCVQRFENGNTFIDYVSDILEVNEAKEIMFEEHITNLYNYRCRRFNWYPKMVRPYLNFEINYNEEVVLYFKQFGDSTIQYYNLYHGTDKNNLTLFDTTSNTYYVALFEDYGMNYFAVTSVDSSGHESDFSNILSQYLTLTEPMSNMVRNSECNYSRNWDITADEGIEFEENTRAKNLEVKLLNPGDDLSELAIVQQPFALINRKTYYLEFDAWAESPRLIEAKLTSSILLYTNYSKNGKSYLTTKMQHYTYTFTMEETSDPAAMLLFEIGQDTNTVYIDNVSLKCLEEGINVDFEIFTKVNFQKSSETPQYYYSIDTGAVYDTLIYHYGWNVENLNAESRESATDFRYKDFNYLKKGDEEFSWEIEVPATKYAVKIGMGDADSSNQINQVYIEGNLVDDPDGEDNYDTIVFSDFDVTDGKLTISPGPQAKNAKIDYIDIYFYEKALRAENYSAVLKSSMLVYPNPSKDELTIEFNNDKVQQVDINIYDMMGRKVMNIDKGSFSTGKHIISTNVSQLPKSIYFICIQMEENILTKKILIK